MNPVIEAILQRRSVRSYTDKAVSCEDLEQIIACGQYAATALGLQPWHFSVVENRALLDEISAANKKIMLASGNDKVIAMASDPNFDNFRGAPVAIIISGDKNLSNYAEADCANAAQNMAVGAYSLGLGSCYIASFKPALEGENGAELKGKIGIPDGFTPFFALAIGYQKGDLPERAIRKENTVNYVK